MQLDPCLKTCSYGSNVPHPVMPDNLILDIWHHQLASLIHQHASGSAASLMNDLDIELDAFESMYPPAAMRAMLDRRDADGKTLLHHIASARFNNATVNQKENLLLNFIGGGCSPDAQDATGQTFVHCLAATDDADFGHLFASAGLPHAMLDLPDHARRTPLMLACAAQDGPHWETAACLASFGADSDCRNQDGQPLFDLLIARYDPANPACGWLLQYAADHANVRYQDKNGDSVLHKLMRAGITDENLIARVYVRGGINGKNFFDGVRNKAGDTLLHEAVRLKRPDMLGYFAPRVDWRIVNAKGKTAIDMACESGDAEKVHLLAERLTPAILEEDGMITPQSRAEIIDWLKSLKPQQGPGDNELRGPASVIATFVLGLANCNRFGDRTRDALIDEVVINIPEELLNKALDVAGRITGPQ
jgi:ankyrin repeat protein